MDFQNRPTFERSTRFYVTITGNFERFQYFNFEANFLKDEKLFKKGSKVVRLKRQHFHTKLPCQKPILRQIEW